MGAEVVEMTSTTRRDSHGGAVQALGAPQAAVRLAAAMHLGSHPAPAQIRPLVARCAVEPDAFVRDMLTWALIQHDDGTVVDLLLLELASPEVQARSQALHTLSKIGGPRVWAAIGPDLLTDPEDEVARAAWRAAVRVVPPGEAAQLAGLLATQLGRGSREVQLSLSRALMALGEAAVRHVELATSCADDDVRTHALATARMMADPDREFDVSVHEATRVRTLRGAPLVGEQHAHR